MGWQDAPLVEDKKTPAWMSAPEVSAPSRSLAGDVSSIVTPPQSAPLPTGLGGWMERIGRAAKESVMAPIAPLLAFGKNKQGQDLAARAMSPVAGQVGMSQLAQEVGDAGRASIRASGSNVAEKIATGPLANVSPNLAAGVGAGVGAVTDLGLAVPMMTPQDVVAQGASQGLSLGAGLSMEAAQKFLRGLQKVSAGSALGGMKAVFNKIRGGSGRFGDASVAMQEKGAFGPFTGAEEMMNKVSAIKDTAGAEMGKVHAMIDSLDNPVQSIKKQYPIISQTVDGREVGGTIKNTSSIPASLTDYTELPGIREVKLDSFEWKGKPTYYSTSEELRTKNLANRIIESNRIDPLIVVIDDKGPYILEGGHRFDAMREIGAKSFPAKIVIDNSSFNVPKSLDFNKIGKIITDELTPKIEGPMAESAKAEVAKIVQTLEANGATPDYKTIMAIKRQIDPGKWGDFQMSGMGADSKKIFEIRQRATAIIGKAIDEGVETATKRTPEIAKKYLEAKKTYGMAADVLKGITDKTERLNANQYLNLAAGGVASVGLYKLINGDPEGAAKYFATAAGIKYVKSLGPQQGAIVYKALGDSLKAAGKAMTPEVRRVFEQGTAMGFREILRRSKAKK